jgi:hypothetical protein
MSAILLNFMEWIVGLQNESNTAHAIFPIVLLCWCLFIGLGLIHTTNVDESEDHNCGSTSSVS